MAQLRQLRALRDAKWPWMWGNGPVLERTGQLSPPSLVEDMRSSARSQPKIWHWRAAKEPKGAAWWMKDWHGPVTMTTTVKLSLIYMPPKWKTGTSDFVSSERCHEQDPERFFFIFVCLFLQLHLHLSCHICSGRSSNHCVKQTWPEICRLCRYRQMLFAKCILAGVSNCWPGGRNCSPATLFCGPLSKIKAWCTRSLRLWAVGCQVSSSEE